ncbi:formate dehydrogenase subunit delta [Celeribacter arenosi]|uniref:Formate dehydrogenase subunit delta n=1 Tax=Celeribacter arenosi TaxID=792649 RepID=A0ABP7K6R2_9RHOB
MTDDKMVRMANQIAAFFETQPEAEKAAKVAGHLNDFWPPSMRMQLKAYVERGGEGLNALVHKSAAFL